MRILSLVMLLASACGDDVTPANPIEDLSVKMAPDMAVPAGTKTCLQVASCAQGCMGMAVCISNCAVMGTLQAQMKFQALGACTVAACTATPDGGGAPPCSSAGDTSQGCQDCFSNAAQGPGCSNQFAACLSDQ